MDPVTGMGQALGLGDIAPGNTTGPGQSAGAQVYDRAEMVPEMVLHSEQLALSTRRVPAERVRLVRRIITETRMVPVEIRREVLDVERTRLDGDTAGTSAPTATAPSGPVVVVLHEEVPLFTLGVRAVERVTATVTEVAGQTAVRAEVSSEQIEVVNVPPPAPQV